MTDSRAKILQAIRNNKPNASALPEIPLFNESKVDVISSFQNMVQSGGGQAIELEVNEISDFIKNQFPEAVYIASTVAEVNGNVDLFTIENPQELEKVDVAIIPAQMGVAENGAVWVTEQEIVHRVLPFITQHLVVLLKKDQIVQNMHEAYNHIKVNDTGFGVFIAGPSKTADIEQSLVIGAQGARSFTVLLY
ncbi:MAG: lactate utilization protein C [Saprospiraceae bacterium]